MRPMTKNPRTNQRKALRGQATVEYSVVSHSLLFFGAAGLLPVMTQLFKAVTTYFDSVYAVIQTAAL
jgi:Flp pilus assembly pilin Flp